jgi:hypothetical protein
VEYNNFDDGDGVDHREDAYRQLPRGLSSDVRLRLYRERALRQLQRTGPEQRTVEEQRRLGRTAAAKIKIPIVGCEQSLWGLPFNDNTMHHAFQVRRQYLYQTSPSAVAGVLETVGGDAYVPPPYPTYQRWDVSDLERWARAIRERIDGLNFASARLRDAIAFKIDSRFNVKNLAQVQELMSVREWKDLSSEGGLIRSAPVQKLDRLVSRYHENHTALRIRIGALAGIVEVAADYLENRRGSRTLAVMALGKQALDIIKRGAPNRSFIHGVDQTGNALIDEALGR